MLPPRGAAEWVADCANDMSYVAKLYSTNTCRVHMYRCMGMSCGDAEEAATLFREALCRMRTVMGQEHPETLQCAWELAEFLGTNSGIAEHDKEAEALCLEVLRSRQVCSRA